MVPQAVRQKRVVESATRRENFFIRIQKNKHSCTVRKLSEKSKGKKSLKV
jgi:hypothetical protein